MFPINFNQRSSQFLYHERFREISSDIFKGLSYLENHFILFSSGTTSSYPKGYAVSETALFSNAQAVNDFFKLTKNDVWGLSLPWFHIGGLSVIARSHLLGSKLVDLSGKWNPHSWAKKIEDEKVSITTVVPTQIFDIVENNISSPPCLKYIIVGGDFLSSELAKRARKLGWPVIRTFGMTEICSQLASSSTPTCDDLEVLPIHKIRIDDNKRLWVKSNALYTLEFSFKDGTLSTSLASSHLDDQGYFPTNDLVEWDKGKLIHFGRIDDQIKINSRLTSLNTLKDQLYTFAFQHNLYGHLELSLKDDSRSGKVIEVLYDKDFNQELLEQHFSPTKITFRRVDQFLRTDLGKLKK